MTEPKADARAMKYILESGDTLCREFCFDLIDDLEAAVAEVEELQEQSVGWEKLAREALRKMDVNLEDFKADYEEQDRLKAEVEGLKRELLSYQKAALERSDEQD